MLKVTFNGKEIKESLNDKPISGKSPKEVQDAFAEEKESGKSEYEVIVDASYYLPDERTEVALHQRRIVKGIKEAWWQAYYYSLFERDCENPVVSIQVNGIGYDERLKRIDAECEAMFDRMAEAEQEPETDIYEVCA